jgi:hypothetical protein
LLTERSIINFLVWVGGLILGPYLAVSALEYNFLPLGVTLGACALVLIFGLLRDKMSLSPFIGGFWTGSFSFIPLHPGFDELAALAVIAYYVIAYAALQRKKVHTGPLFCFIPILILALIILYHEHSTAVRAAGGGREGGRPAIFILVAAITYLCGVSINSPSPRFLFWLPLWCVATAAVSAIPAVVTTFLPSTAPYFYVFSTNINITAYQSEILDTDSISRSQGLGRLGAVVVIFLLSYFPFYTWWRPNRWWIAILALVCIPLVVMEGFRSDLATFGLTILVAAWCYSRWRALLLVPPLVIGVFLAALLQSAHIIHLPKSAQRGLSFIPGDWDPDVLSSTLSSNEFRDKILKVYLAEDVTKSPLLGNGVSYDAAEFERYNTLALYHDTPDGYYSTKIYVTGKIFHSGWMSLYDAVGIVGFAAYVFLTGGLIWATGRMIFRKDADHTSPLFPLKVWMFCNILPSFIGYFAVYGDFKVTFPGLCYYAILWTQLDRLEKFGYRLTVPMRLAPFDPSRADQPVSA